MCVGDDRHCLCTFAHPRRETNRYSFRLAFLRFVYHMRWAFSFFLCWIKFWAFILHTCWTNAWTYAGPCVDLCQTSAGHVSWFLYFACIMSLIRLVGIPSMSIIRFAGSPLGFEMIGWMWGTTFSINASGCQCHCHCYVYLYRCVNWYLNTVWCHEWLICLWREMCFCECICCRCLFYLMLLLFTVKELAELQLSGYRELFVASRSTV